MRQFSSGSAIATSIGFLVVFAITAYGTGYALGDNESRLGDVHAAVELVPQHTAGTVLLNTAELPPPEAVGLEHIDEDGAEIYMTRCMSCHQMNGRGVSGVFPPLAGTEWVTGDKGRLIRVVLNGLTGEIDVDGETYSGAMPPWQSFLDDEQTAALLSYIRQAWGNEASEVTSSEVASVRTATKERRDPWTEEELLQEENLGIPGEGGDAASDATEGQDSSNDPN